MYEPTCLQYTVNKDTPISRPCTITIIVIIINIIYCRTETANETNHRRAVNMCAMLLELYQGLHFLYYIEFYKKKKPIEPVCVKSYTYCNYYLLNIWKTNIATGGKGKRIRGWHLVNIKMRTKHPTIASSSNRGKKGRLLTLTFTMMKITFFKLTSRDVCKHSSIAACHLHKK